jgi:hypothetical protein
MLLLVTKSSEKKKNEKITKINEETNMSEDKHTPIEIVTKFHLQKSNRFPMQFLKLITKI